MSGWKALIANHYVGVDSVRHRVTHLLTLPGGTTATAATARLASTRTAKASCAQTSLRQRSTRVWEGQVRCDAMHLPASLGTRGLS